MGWGHDLCIVTQSCLTLCNPWTVARQAPLSMGLCKQEHWSGLPLPTPGDLPDPGINPTPHKSPVWQADSLPLHHLGRPWEKEDAAYYFTHTHPRNIPELPRNLEHHKHFYVVSICLSESLCSDNCHDEWIGGFKSLCQGMGVIPTAPVFPGHVPGHKCIDTPGRGSAK